MKSPERPTTGLPLFQLAQSSQSLSWPSLPVDDGIEVQRARHLNQYHESQWSMADRERKKDLVFLQSKPPLLPAGVTVGYQRRSWDQWYRRSHRRDGDQRSPERA